MFYLLHEHVRRSPEGIRSEFLTSVLEWEFAVFPQVPRREIQFFLRFKARRGNGVCFLSTCRRTDKLRGLTPVPTAVDDVIFRTHLRRNLYVAAGIFLTRTASREIIYSL